jgi:2-dehydro-3-deoxyglucarate aldolase/4-hydroxy-2-oxoheptanedioate aldolase
MTKSFKKRLLEKESMIGTLLTIPSPEIAELMAKSGFDWLFIDMEHSAIGIREAQQMIQAASPHAHCVIRVPGKEEAWIKKALDTGAEGIIIPRVNTVTEAMHAVRFSKYPPQGNRSVGISRAHGYGLDFKSYIKSANDDVALIVQCEDKEAVQNLPKILKVEGIDCIFVGPYDLSGSYGKLGMIEDNEVLSAVETIHKTSVEAGMPLGIFGTKPEVLLAYKKTGFNLVAIGLDAGMLTSAAQNLLQKMQD